MPFFLSSTLTSNYNIGIGIVHPGEREGGVGNNFLPSPPAPTREYSSTEYIKINMKIFHYPLPLLHHPLLAPDATGSP